MSGSASRVRALHLNTYSEGGAAWAARRIQEALRRAGVDSRFCCQHGPAPADALQVERGAAPWSHRIRHRLRSARVARRYGPPTAEEDALLPFSDADVDG